jgi:hypothetical protein
MQTLGLQATVAKHVLQLLLKGQEGMMAGVDDLAEPFKSLQLTSPITPSLVTWIILVAENAPSVAMAGTLLEMARLLSTSPQLSASSDSLRFPALLSLAARDMLGQSQEFEAVALYHALATANLTLFAAQASPTDAAAVAAAEQAQGRVCSLLDKERHPALWTQATANRTYFTL